jgi:hypothetical protein
MRPLRVRVTLRRLLVVAAVIEAVAVVVLLVRRSEDFRDRALYHAAEEAVFIAHAHLWETASTEGCTEVPPDATPAEYAWGAERCRRWAAYEAALAHRYRQAAAHPWLPVGADPTAPD